MYRIHIILILLLVFTVGGLAQNDTPQEHSESMPVFIDSLFMSGLESKLIPGGVVVLSGPEQNLFQKAYGYANVQNEIRVNFDSTLFQLGSIGKTVTAIAALQQVETGNLKLDVDINMYLKEQLIRNPYSTPLTLEHLLTHTAGLNDRNIGYLYKTNKELQPLGDYLQKYMPGLFQEPGLSINYSNFGYGLVGFLVEQSSNLNFKEYVHLHIFDSLKMDRTSYELPDSYRSLPQYARGYEVRKQFNEVNSYPRNLWPAGSIVSTGKDMSRLLQALIRKEKVLGRTSYSRLYKQQFSNHPALPGVTFGFEEQLINGHRFIAKGGQVRGFLSMLVLFPEEELGLFIAVNTETDNFLRKFIKEFTDRFFPPENGISEKYKETTPADVTGTYRNQRASHGTIEELFSLMMDNIKVIQSTDTTLGIIEGNRFSKYRAVADSIYEGVENTSRRLVFVGLHQSNNSLYTSAKVAGLQVPATYEKIPWLYAPDTINEIYPFLLLPIPLYFLILLYWPAIWLLRRRKEAPQNSKSLPLYIHLSALTVSGLFVLDIAGFFVPLIAMVRSGEILFGLPGYLLNFKYLHWLMAGLLTVVLFNLIFIWLKKQSYLGVRIGYTFYSISALFYVLLLIKWHFFNVVI